MRPFIELNCRHKRSGSMALETHRCPCKHCAYTEIYKATPSLWATSSTSHSEIRAHQPKGTGEPPSITGKEEAILSKTLLAATLLAMVLTLTAGCADTGQQETDAQAPPAATLTVIQIFTPIPSHTPYPTRTPPATPTPQPTQKPPPTPSPYSTTPLDPTGEPLPTRALYPTLAPYSTQTPYQAHTPQPATEPATTPQPTEPPAPTATPAPTQVHQAAKTPHPGPVEPSESEILDELTGVLWMCVTNVPDFREEFIAGIEETGLSRGVAEAMLADRTNFRTAVESLVEEDPSTAEEMQALMPFLKEMCAAPTP